MKQNPDTRKFRYQSYVLVFIVFLCRENRQTFMNLIASPTVVKSKRTCRKSTMKTTKRKKANEKSRNVPKRQGTNPTRPSTHGTDHLVDTYDKENHPINNNGFTQLIQTKMMDTKKRQGHRKNKEINHQNDHDSTSVVTRKRLRSG